MQASTGSFERAAAAPGPPRLSSGDGFLYVRMYVCMYVYMYVYYIMLSTIRYRPFVCPSFRAAATMIAEVGANPWEGETRL
jgi:hypothetical protein